MNILVSTICFVNRQKPGAEIYSTFAQRLIEDVMQKTPYDIMITTNEPEHFLNQKEIYGDRVIIRTELLETHRLTVGVFNQLLKFYSIQYHIIYYRLNFFHSFLIELFLKKLNS